MSPRWREVFTLITSAELIMIIWTLKAGENLPPGAGESTAVLNPSRLTM